MQNASPNLEAPSKEAHIVDPKSQEPVLASPKPVSSRTETAVTHGDVTTPAHVSSDDLGVALTVEQFLRRSAASTKRYSARRNRRTRRRAEGVVSLVADPADHDSDSDYEPEDQDQTTSSSSPRLASRRRGRRIVWTSDEEDDSPQQPAPKRRRKQRKKPVQPLSARILAAALVTGVDVVGGPLLPISSSTTSVRRPLPFAPGNRAPSPVGVKSRFKIEPGHFVDPRKETPFDRAVFQFGPSFRGDTSRVSGAQGERKPKEARPVTAWMPDSCGDGQASTLRTNVNRSAHGGPCKPEIVRRVTVPLKMVPASDCRSLERDRYEDTTCATLSFT